MIGPVFISQSSREARSGNGSDVGSTLAFAGYGVSHISDSNWKDQPWSNTTRAALDAAIYAVRRSLTFCSLDPAA